ncbi:alpha/beta hydrolase [Mycetocola zhadangensis]|nr:alpha/beta hydrolase [Mycetocola zhadangensis]
MDHSKRLIRTIGRLGPRLLRSPRVADVTVRWVRFGGLRLRIYEPRRSSGRPAVLWIHGGGLVIGSPKQDDRLCLSTVAALGIPVVSVEYRLAPESPFPAALHDALTTWRWIHDNADALGIDPARVVVAGESAGGSIAASLVHKLHDDGGIQPAAQWLFAPMLDDRTAARRELDATDHPVWNNKANRFGWRSYLNQEPGAATVPPYSVPSRRSDLSNLPPTWLCAGDIELFYDEIAAYAERLRAAGVAVEFETVVGGAHGFENWAGNTQLAQNLIERAQRWLAATLDLE